MDKDRGLEDPQERLRANLDLCDKDGCTLINQAVRNKNHEMIKLLSHLGANLNLRDEMFLLTPLELALFKNHLETVKFLIELGADPNQFNESGHTLLTQVISDKDPDAMELVKIFAKLGVDIDFPNVNKVTPLILSVINKNVELINLLIDLGANVNALGFMGETVLMNSIIRRDFEEIKLLVKLGADITCSNGLNFTPLDYAKIDGNVELIKLITKLEKDSQIKKADAAPSIKSEQIATSINYKEMPLIEAIINHDLEKVELLVKKENHKLNVRNSLGFTPLIKAISLGDKKMVQRLIQLGAKIDFSSGKGQFTPLTYAVLKNNYEMVELLVELDADINLTTKLRPSPLSLAVITSNERMVRLLVSLGADLGIERPLHPLTPLSEAALKGNMKMVKLLIELGADVNQIDKGGLPFYLLSERRDENYKEISAYIKSISPEAAHQKREISLLKGIGHSTEQEGYTTLIPTVPSLKQSQINLESGHAHKWLHEMAKSTLSLSLEYPNIMPVALSEELQEAFIFSAGVKVHSDKEIVARIQSNKFTFIPTGFSSDYRGLGGHSVSVLMKGSHLFICNRGDSSRRSIEMYSFDPTKLNPGIIKQIRNQAEKGSADFKQFFFNDLPKELNFKQSSLELTVERECPFGKQKVGNCSWASLETAVWACLVMKQIENPTIDEIPDLIKLESKRFYSWLIFTQFRQIESYLELPLLSESSLSSQKAKRRVYEIDFNVVEKGLKNIRFILDLGVKNTGYEERLLQLESKVQKMKK